LALAASLSAITITDLTDTGQPLGGLVSVSPAGLRDDDWKVSGGDCPFGAATCLDTIAVNPFSNASVYVPLDTTIIPVGWNGFPWDGPIQGALGSGSWIVPAVRNDGKVDNHDPGDEGDNVLDFGSFTYEYSTTFSLPVNFDTVTIAGLAFADGEITADCGIEINGTCVSFAQNGPEHWQDGITFNIPFSAGLYNSGTDANTIIFRVANAGNESGLKVNFTTVDYTESSEVVPEPSTYALLGGGLLALAALRRRK
jgi:hypothetical protein